MKTIRYRFARRVAVAVLGMLAALPARPAEPPLVLGILPRYTYAETQEMFRPLARQLGQALGRPVRLETTRDFESFWDAVTQKRYDIVHLNQYQYALAHREHGYRLVAKNEEQGDSTLASVILARKDSGIRSLAELKGKHVMFGGDRSATMAYLVPREMLRAAGVAPGSYREEFALNPPNALLAVALRQADACGVGESVLRQQAAQGAVNLAELAVIARSAPMPHLPWAVRGDLDAGLRSRIRDALLDLTQTESGRQILQRARLTALVAASEPEYEAFHRMARDTPAPH